MFSLNKTGDNWILHYEVGLLRRLLLVGAGAAGVGVAMVQSAVLPLKFEIPLIILCLAVIGYWVASDLPTTATFDLEQRRVRVESQRPWFGAARLFAFADVAALHAVRQSGESTDFWEAMLELNSGKRISLGSESGAATSGCGNIWKISATRPALLAADVGRSVMLSKGNPLLAGRREGRMAIQMGMRLDGCRRK